MVVYKLVCGSKHEFEGWFSSSEEYDRQHDRGLITCPICNNGKITRLPSAPYVNTGKSTPPPAVSADEAHAAVRDLMEALYRSSEDVGQDFPEEARKIHYQEAPARTIRGAATVKDFQELREEGIDVFPLLPRPEPGKLH